MVFGRAKGAKMAALRAGDNLDMPLGGLFSSLFSSYVILFSWLGMDISRHCHYIIANAKEHMEHKESRVPVPDDCRVHGATGEVGEIKPQVPC